MMNSRQEESARIWASFRSSDFSIVGVLIGERAGDVEMIQSIGTLSEGYREDLPPL